MIDGRMTMTNREKLSTMTDQELAEYVCDLDTASCTGCPGVALCVSGDGHANGMIKWLEAEWRDKE